MFKGEGKEREGKCKIEEVIGLKLLVVLLVALEDAAIEAYYLNQLSKQLKVWA